MVKKSMWQNPYPKCDVVHDRNSNAAKNILAEGFRQNSINNKLNRQKLPKLTLVEIVGYETDKAETPLSKAGTLLFKTNR